MKWLKYALLFLLTITTTSLLFGRSKTDPTPIEHTEPKIISDTSELLASHETVALFKGISNKGCRFLTAQCPDKCTHSTTWAEFSIKRYNSFQSYSQYGTKQQNIAFALDGDNAIHDKRIVRDINKLKKGDKVVLNWNHLYITSNGNSYPLRVIQKLENFH